MSKGKFLERKYLEPIFLLVFAFFYFSNYAKHSIFTIYQGRDIQRALDLLNGQWIWHGPDLTGGGHTPGPFYYYLLAIPLSIFGTWQSVLWLELLLLSGASVILWHLVKTYHDSFAALAIYFLFLTSFVFFVCTVQFWNPSFLFFFQAVLLYIFYDYKKIGTRRLILGGLLLGLTLQIHYQQAVFFIGILGVIAWDRQKTLRERLFSLSILSASAFLPLVPHFLFQKTHDGTYYSLSAGIEALWFSVEKLFVLQNPLRPSPRLDLRGFFNLFKNEINFFPLIALWLFICWRAIGRKVRAFEMNRYIALTAVVAAFLILPNFYEPFYLRYAIPFFLCFYVLSAPMLSWVQRSYPQNFLIGLAMFIGFLISRNFDVRSPEGWEWAYLFLFIGLAGIVVFYLSTPKSRLVTFLLMTSLFWNSVAFLTAHVEIDNGYASDLQRRDLLAKTLVQETGWKWEHFRERSFIIGKLPEEDLRTMYRQHLRNRDSIKPKYYDGVMIVYDWETRVLDEVADAEFKWELLNNIIPAEIFEAAIEKRIECKKAIRAANYQICFYKFSDSSFPVTWNNFGYPYQFEQPLLYSLPSSTGGRKTTEGSWEFYWNPCEVLEASCTIYFFVKKLEGSVAAVTVIGDPVSVPQGVMNPALAVSLENLMLEIRCGLKSFVHPVASVLGYSVLGRSYRSPTFHGPFQNLVPFNCPNPSQLTFSAARVRSMSKLKPFPLEFPLITWNAHE